MRKGRLEKDNFWVLKDEQPVAFERGLEIE